MIFLFSSNVNLMSHVINFLQHQDDGKQVPGVYSVDGKLVRAYSLGRAQPIYWTKAHHDFHDLGNAPGSSAAAALKTFSQIAAEELDSDHQETPALPQDLLPSVAPGPVDSNAVSVSAPADTPAVETAPVIESHVNGNSAELPADVDAPVVAAVSSVAAASAPVPAAIAPVAAAVAPVAAAVALVGAAVPLFLPSCFPQTQERLNDFSNFKYIHCIQRKFL